MKIAAITSNNDGFPFSIINIAYLTQCFKRFLPARFFLIFSAAGRPRSQTHTVRKFILKCPAVFPVFARSHMIPVPKSTVKGSLTVESALHTDVQNIVICGFQTVNGIVHACIVQILAEISVKRP